MLGGKLGGEFSMTAIQSEDGQLILEAPLQETSERFLEKTISW